jgi:hypothetical protein
MKSMTRMVPSARKTKKAQERERKTNIFIEGVMEELKQMPPAEREEIVGLVSSLSVRKKNGGKARQS